MGFSFGFPVDERVQAIVDLIPASCWHPAIEDGGELREGAWVAEATGMIDLSAWPEGSRLILRKERPHPGAQLTFTDVDGHRITAFLTDTARGVIPGQAAGLELRHRQHARVEDRIRQAKAAGLRNLPCRGWEENNAWLEAVLAAADLVCWAKLICFAAVPSLARCEIAAFPLPGAARRRPAHPLRPAAHRPRLAVGRPDRRRLPPAAHRLRLTSPACRVSPHHRLAPACPPAAITPASRPHPSLAMARARPAPARRRPPARDQDQTRHPGDRSEVT